MPTLDDSENSLDALKIRIRADYEKATGKKLNDKEFDELLQKAMTPVESPEEPFADEIWKSVPADELARGKASYKKLSAATLEFKELVKAIPNKGKSPGELRQSAIDEFHQSLHPFLKKLTREEVLETYQSGEGLTSRNFRDLDLSGIDFTGADFTGSLFTRTNFKGSNLRSANFTKCKFDNVNATECCFDNSILKNSLWLNASNLHKSSFKSVTASKMRAIKCDFSHCDFSDSRLDSSFFSKSTLDGTLFRNSNLERMILIGTTAKQCNFSSSNWNKGFVHKSSISASSLKSCSAKSLTLWSTDASAIDAQESSLVGLRAGGKGTRLDQSCFDRADLSNSSQMNLSARFITLKSATFDRSFMKNIDLTGSNWTGATGKKSRLTRCNFSEANLKHINTMSGSWRKSTFSKTIVDYACFYSNEFYGATFIETNLSSAYTAKSSLKHQQKRDAAEKKDKKKGD